MARTENESFYNKCKEKFPELYIYDKYEDKNYEIWSGIKIEAIDSDRIYDSLIESHDIFCEHLPSGLRVVEYRKLGLRVEFMLKDDNVDDIYGNVNDDGEFFDSLQHLLYGLHRIDIDNYVVSTTERDIFSYGDVVYFWGAKKVESGVFYGKFMSDGKEKIMIMADLEGDKTYKMTLDSNAVYKKLADLFFDARQNAALLDRDFKAATINIFGRVQ